MARLIHAAPEIEVDFDLAVTALSVDVLSLPDTVPSAAHFQLAAAAGRRSRARPDAKPTK
jgi:hypothetical protein